MRILKKSLVVGTIALSMLSITTFSFAQKVPSIKVSPHLTLGLAENGGVAVKGSYQWEEGRIFDDQGNWMTGYYGRLKASLDSADDEASVSQVAVDARAALYVYAAGLAGQEWYQPFTLTEPVQLYVELTRESIDTSEKQTGTSASGVRNKYAVGVEIPFPYLWVLLDPLSNLTGKRGQTPGFEIVYRGVRSDSALANVDGGLEEDEISFKLSGTIPLYAKKIKTELTIEGSYTKPVGATDDSWQGLWDISWAPKSDKNLKPVLRYRSGEESGLEFDRQVLIGLVAKLG